MGAARGVGGPVYGSLVRDRGGASTPAARSAGAPARIVSRGGFA